MAQFDISIDVVAGAVIGGAITPLAVNLPQFVQGDTPTLRIFPYNPTYNPITPYIAMPIAGLSLMAALGDKVGNATNYYTQQFTWAASTDPQNPNYWIAPFPLNTDAITTLIGAKSQAQTTFHVEYISAGVPTTILEVPVTIQAAVIKNGGVIVPAGLTALSAEAANATFLKRTIEGAFFLKNTTTGKTYAVYMDDNGLFKCDEVVP